MPFSLRLLHSASADVAFDLRCRFIADALFRDTLDCLIFSKFHSAPTPPRHAAFADADRAIHRC
jgi:hypothetical protein